MKTINDLLKHAKHIEEEQEEFFDQVELLSKFYNSELVMEKMIDYQYDYNVAMYKLQIETLGISAEREGKIIKLKK